LSPSRKPSSAQSPARIARPQPTHSRVALAAIRLCGLGISLLAGLANADPAPELWGYGVRSCAQFQQACADAAANNAAEYQR
jgi:hypothetical protein